VAALVVNSCRVARETNTQRTSNYAGVSHVNNVALELAGLDPLSSYNHDMMLVIDEGGGDTIYLHRGLWDNKPAIVRQGRFWSWAKRVHDKHWLTTHS
jgi:hypothetical protein